MRTLGKAMNGLAVALLMSACGAGAAVAQADAKSSVCVNRWNHSNPNFITAVKAGLPNSGSFAHVSTTEAQHKGKGAYLQTMIYRSKGADGAVKQATAYAAVEPDTCAATVIHNKAEMARLIGS